MRSEGPSPVGNVYMSYRLSSVLALLLGIVGAGMEKRFLRDAAEEALDAAVSSGPTLHLLALLNPHTRHRRPSAAAKAAVLQVRRVLCPQRSPAPLPQHTTPPTHDPTLTHAGALSGHAEGGHCVERGSSGAGMSAAAGATRRAVEHSRIRRTGLPTAVWCALRRRVSHAGRATAHRHTQVFDHTAFTTADSFFNTV